MIHETLPWLLSIGKYILASAALMVFYRSFFRKNATYLESRIFLLSVALVAVMVSQFRIQVTHPAPTIVEVEREASLQSVVAGMSIQMNPTGVTEGFATTPGKTLIWLGNNTLQVLLMGYILVVLILLFNLMLQYNSIRKLLKKGKISLHNEYKLVEHSEVSTPFSFAKTIFIPSNLNESQREVVLTHELWHIRHKHYIDVFMQEILSSLFWFNPVQWLLRKDLRSVHEFQADRSVLNEGCDLYRYQTIILEEVMGNHYRLANGFNQSFTKKRFIQMKNIEPKKLTTKRKLLFVPFLTLLFAVLSFVPGKSQVIKVERTTKTSTNINGNITTVTSHSIDTIPGANDLVTNFFSSYPIAVANDPSSNFLSSGTNATLNSGNSLLNALSPGMSTSQIQQSFNFSLDSLHHIVNRILPIVSQLAASAQPSKNVKDMDALLESLQMRANNQGVSYQDFSDETKNSFTQQDFKEFEKVLRNINDSIKVLRTRKVDRIDSPDFMKLIALAQGMLTSSLIQKVFPELFRIMGNNMASMMQGFTGGASALEIDQSKMNSDAKEAGNMMGQLFENMGNLMGQMTKTMPTFEEIPAIEETVEEIPAIEEAAESIPTSEVSTESETSLANLAYNDNDPVVRKQAVSRITNEAVLANIAYNDQDKSVRKLAVNRIKNEAILANVAYNDKDAEVRKLAVNRIKNESVLTNVAYNDENSPIRKLAVSKLSNQAVLANVAYNDKDEEVRIAAINKITNSNSLINIANSANNSKVKQAAKNRSSILK